MGWFEFCLLVFFAVLRGRRVKRRRFGKACKAGELVKRFSRIPCFVDLSNLQKLIHKNYLSEMTQIFWVDTVTFSAGPEPKKCCKLQLDFCCKLHIFVESGGKKMFFSWHKKSKSPLIQIYHHTWSFLGSVPVGICS